MVNFRKNKIALAVVAANLTLFAGGSMAQEAEQVDETDSLEEVVVLGYRAALERALDAKRDAIHSRESIMAEDIGKFPDLNLAESIQRVPGVAISREGGEGRQVTLRGLGPEFTRTTLNGMEVPASTDGLDSSGGLNGGRAFDFNVFSSDLFNRIDIQKSSRASTEEGGIAGTVDLYTPKPFDNPGFHAGVSGQLGYNSITEETDPRLSAFVSNTFAEDKFGVLFTVSKTERTVRQEGFGTVRWDKPSSAGGWADTSSTVVNGNLAPGRTLDDVFSPRLPRTDYFGNEQDRFGVSGSLQFRPNDRTEFTLDYVRSEFENTREAYNLMAQFRSQYDDITPSQLTLDPTGNFVTGGSFDDVNFRNESRQNLSETVFDQFVLSGEFDISETMKLSAMYGTSKSDFRVEQYRFNINVNNDLITPFSFDLGENGNVASMSYGANLLDESLYTFSGETIRANDVVRKNDTARVDLDISLGDVSKLYTGIIFNDRTVDSAEFDAIKGPDPISTAGLVKALPVSDFGKGLGAPDGFPTTWLVSDFAASTAAHAVTGWKLRQSDGDTRQVQEESLGIYIDYDTEFQVMGDKSLRLNAGVRYVDTQVTSSAFVSIGGGDVLPVTVESEYDHFLPSLNLALDVTDNLVGRFSIARTMARPSLSSLSPNASIGVNNGEIRSGNPSLVPIEADSVDLGFEWYFAEGEGFVGATYFYKDIQGFIARFSEDRPLDSLSREIVLSDSRCPSACVGVDDLWTYSQPLNNRASDLKGFEIAYQQPFNFLEGPFSDMGVVLNFTHVDSESQYGQGADTVTSQLIGLSENSWNATLYYEVDQWGMRLSANDRDDYVTRVPGRNNNNTEATSGSMHVDFSAFYNFSENLTFTLEAVNLTDEEERLFVSGDTGNLNLVREFNHTGRQLFFGARYVY